VGAEAAAPAAPMMAGWLSALVYLVGFFLVSLVFGPLLGLPLMLAKVAASGRQAVDDPSHLFNPSGIGVPLWTVLVAVVTWGSFLVALGYTAVLVYGIEKRPLWGQWLGWRMSTWRDLVVGMGLAAVFFVSVAGVGAARNWYQFQSVAPATEALAIVFGGFWILLPAAAAEEVSTRGYFFHAVERSWGAPAALGLSSLAFAALHLNNPHIREHPLAIVGLLLAGVYLGSAYLITRNLWLAIFLHTGWNLMEGPVFGLPVSGIHLQTTVVQTRVTGPELWTGGAFGPEAGLLLCLVMLFHLGTLWALRPVLGSEAERGRL